MKCNFCKRNEDEIKNVFSLIIKDIEQKIANLDDQICKIKKEYPVKHGFTNEIFEIVINIKEPILEMKIISILDNLDPFLKLDPNLKYLTDYYKKYKPDIPIDNSIKDLMKSFLQEPTKSRLSNEVKEYVKNRSELSNCIKNINKENVLSELNSEYKIPLNVFNFDDEFLVFLQNQISNVNANNNNMLLCPYCLFLFKYYSEYFIKTSKEIKRKNNLINEKFDDSSSLKEWDHD